jgi:hypothetical protein
MLLLGNLVALRAEAQTPRRQAIILYREGGAHYNRGQYELAVAKYQAAIGADPTLPGPYRNLGLTYRALKKCDLALPYFRKYLQLRPEGRHSDRVRQEIEACRKAVGGASEAPMGAAQIVLRCRVKGAQVHIDGKLRGSTGVEGFPVQPGKHTIAVYRTGYKPWNSSVEVSAGQVVALEVVLSRDSGAETQPSTPTSAPAGTLRVVGLLGRTTVRIDGVEVKVDQEGATRVTSGVHQIEVTGRGLEPWKSQVEVKPGKTTTVMPTLALSESAQKLRRWGWILTGAATAVGLVGGAVGLLENRTHEQIRDYDREAGSREGLNNLLDDRRQQALAANLLYGVAGALLTTGVVLFVLAPEAETRP